MEEYARHEPDYLDELALDLLRGSDHLVLETFLLQHGGRHVAYWANDSSRRGVSSAVSGGIARMDAARLLAGLGQISRPIGLVTLHLFCLCGSLCFRLVYQSTSMNWDGPRSLSDWQLRTIHQRMVTEACRIRRVADRQAAEVSRLRQELALAGDGRTASCELEQQSEELSQVRDELAEARSELVARPPGDARARDLEAVRLELAGSLEDGEELVQEVVAARLELAESRDEGEARARELVAARGELAECRQRSDHRFEDLECHRELLAEARLLAEGQSSTIRDAQGEIFRRRREVDQLTLELHQARFDLDEVRRSMEVQQREMERVREVGMALQRRLVDPDARSSLEPSRPDELLLRPRDVRDASLMESLVALESVPHAVASETSLVPSDSVVVSALEDRPLECGKEIDRITDTKIGRRATSPRFARQR